MFDLSEKNAIHIALFDENYMSDIKEDGMNRDLLGVLDRFLNAEKVSKNDIKGIMVVVGAGGFTSARISAVVANTFAYALQIPILAIEKKDIERAQSLIPKLLAQIPGHYISVSYSGEPNINKQAV